MSTEQHVKPPTPAFCFTRAVCERASKDGWQLDIGDIFWCWSKDDKVIRAFVLYPASAKELLHEACCDLQQHEYPDIKVTID